MYFPSYFYRPHGIQFALTLILVLLANSNGASLGTCPSGYCSTFSGGPAFGLKIRNVEFHTLNNNTTGVGCTTEYQDFCNDFETFVQPNSSYDLIVESGDCPGAFAFGPRRIIVYIDWDQSSSFEASEVVMFEGDYDPLTMPIIADTVSVTIPSGATLGTTRMRVTCLEFTPDSTSAACNVVAGFGEVEDYRITIACPDLDGDGFSDIACGGTDCNDNNNTVFPGAVELPCDNIDNNCDTNIDENRMDADGDTFDECVDCNDGDPTINPGAAELPCDNIDNNCDNNIDENRVDADGDGADECVDCNDGDSSNFPGNVEVCDGQDNNCDGNIDEGFLPTAICQNVTLFLDANGSGSIVPTDIDNGSNSSCGSVTLTASQTDFTCSDLGANNVTLTVRDPYLNEDSCVAVVTVIDSFLIKTCLPNADFAFTDKCLAVDFTDLSISNSIITSYQWDFGDGITSTSQHPSHTYVSSGTYLVCMLVHNQFGSDIKCDTVTVVTTLEEITGRDTTRTCSDNLTFNLASLITGGFSGSVQYGSTFGSYTDTITTDVMVSSDTTFYVRDSVGVSCVDTARIDITIETNLPPMITCPADVTLVCTGDFSSSSIGIPMVSDDCTAYANILISESDQIMIIDEDTSIVQRTWTATDTLGSASMCVQEITLITEYITGRDTTLACGIHTFNLADLITGSFGGSVQYGSTLGNYTETITTDVTVSSDTTFYVRDNVGVGCVDTAVIHINIPSLNNCKVHVNAAVSGGNNDGSSWTDAFADLQDAIDAAYLRDVNTIWVAKGTYLPVADISGNRNPSDPRDKTFFFDKGVRIYGGFAGGETMLSQRDHILNKTILSGNIGNNGISDNTYHVVYTQNAESLEVDGFTIENGYADGSGMTHSMSGGGWYNESVGSGGISTPFIINCSFINNEAIYGGAMYNANAGHQCAPSIIASHFANNIADSGGAIYNTTKSSSGDCSPFIVSCTFYSNEGSIYGGAIMNEASMGTVGNNVIYSTFHNNLASIGAGGIYNNRTGNTATVSTFIDLSIFWKNIGSVKSVSTAGGATAAVSYSLLEEGSCPGNGVTCMGDMIYNENPLFVNAAAGDLHLQSCSPAVDHINQSAVSFLDADIDGDLRPQNDGVDIGADEYTGPICCPSRTRLYVDSSAIAGGDGSTWAMAFDTLQHAIDLACDCNIDTIWVAEGTYYPTVDSTRNIPADPRNKTFFFNKDHQIYGGFAGGESTLSQRDIKANVTTLSGDLDQNDAIAISHSAMLTHATRQDNSYTVIRTKNVSASFVLDGFTITGGNANVDPSLCGNGIVDPGEQCDDGNNFNQDGCSATCQQEVCGDGILQVALGEQCDDGNLVNGDGCSSTCVTESSSNISINPSILDQWPIADPILTNSFSAEHFDINAKEKARSKSLVLPSSHNGGGWMNESLVISGQSNPTITNCSFIHNSANERGGAFYNIAESGSSNPTFKNCYFYQNSASHGGGIYNKTNNNGAQTTVASPHIVSTIFRANLASVDGGAIYNDGSTGQSSPIITNTLFQQNEAIRGAGIYNTDAEFPPASGNYTQSAPQVINCTFTANMANLGSSMYSTRENTNVSPAITNSILWNNGSEVVEAFFPGTTTIDYSIINDGLPDDTVSLPVRVTGSNNIDSDPLFVSATDFRLTSCSPAINAGLNSALPPGIDTDLVGDVRLSAGTVDIGAYEYQGTSNLQMWYEDGDDDGYTSGEDSLTCDRPTGYKLFTELIGAICTNIFTDGFESGDLSNWTSVAPFKGSDTKASTCTSPIGVVTTLQSVPGADAILPNSGTYFYAEQNPNGCLQAQLNQDINIPSGALAKLTFYYTMMYDATGQVGSKKVGIKVSIRPLGGSYTTLYEGEDIDLGITPSRLSDMWRQVSIDLSAYSGMSQIRVEYLDADFPIQYGIDDVIMEHCMLPTDCDDTNPNVHPGVIEICNGIDDNCDDNIDEGLAMTWYRDSDGDGFGDPALSKDTCAMPTGYVADMTDCDDNDANVKPGATEICNGIDDNCDGNIDEGLATTWYRDSDGDGFGDPALSKDTCAMPTGYVADMTDCDDNNPNVKPGATEICNGIDDNCDGNIDEGLAMTWYRDSDMDGFGDPSTSKDSCSIPNGYVADMTDCDDTNPNVKPGATEVCNGIDDNCDGNIDEGLASTWYRDSDGDGFGDPAATKDTCAMPVGYVADMTDCDDNNANVKPGATEICNGIDDNCDGNIDEGLASTWYRDSDGDGFGDPASSKDTCAMPTGYVADMTDCNDNDANVKPGATEICNGIDDNCDGSIDEGLASTWYRDSDGDGFGDPASSKDTCAMPVGYVADMTDCDDTNIEVYPGATEVCDNIDNNCDGEVDLDDDDLVDDALPDVLCQDITIQLDDLGSSTISAGDIDNGTMDNCGIDFLTLNKTTFSCADIGPNMVTLIATDVNGNVDSCSATVIVQGAVMAPIVLGPNAICPSISGIPYQVNMQSGVNSYQWSYTGIGVVINDNGSANITLDFGNQISGGMLLVELYTACGPSGIVGQLDINPGDPTLCQNLECPSVQDSTSVTAVMVNEVGGLDIYIATHLIESSAVIPAQRNILFRAGQAIELEDEFEVEQTATFTAEIGTCQEAFLRTLNEQKR